MSFALLALGLATGLLARHLNWLGASAPLRINAFVIAVALPAMILLRVPALTFDARAVLPVALGWTVILTSAALVVLASRLWRWPAATTGALLLVVPLSNSAYLGVPLIDALFGPAVVPYALLYDQFANFLALSLYAPVVIALLGEHGAPPSPLAVLRRIVTFPPFAVLILALLLPGDALPDMLHPPLMLLSATMGPLAMLIIGFQLEIRVPGALRLPLVFASAVKLLWAPACVLWAAALLKLDGPSLQATAMQAAMPPMVTAGLLGIAAGFSSRLIVAVVGVATLLSALTLALVWLLVR